MSVSFNKQEKKIISIQDCKQKLSHNFYGGNQDQKWAVQALCGLMVSLFFLDCKIWAIIFKNNTRKIVTNLNFAIIWQLADFLTELLENLKINSIVTLVDPD